MGSTLIAGRKLLLADDSPAVQKVIDLTFSDEGMEVATVADGDAALQKLEQFAPDVILADVFMPGVNGYSLCEQIRQHERFGRIPVILLVSSFEPFDETEARRVGADDVVTKPFQSIRQLVNRVGALMSGRVEDFDKTPPTSTLGLESSVASNDENGVSQPHVTVLVEAPLLAEPGVSEVAGASCSPDIELQIADTQQLRPLNPQVEREVVAAPSNAEQRFVSPYATDPRMNPHGLTATTMEMTDALLDLDDVTITSAAADDFILDLDTEIAPPDVRSTVPAPVIAVREHFDVTEVTPLIELGKTDVESQWGRDRSVEEAPQLSETPAEPIARTSNISEVSPQIVDAIARKVVEQLSDKVVREIAWEVVPELAELLIKQRLEEQKR